MISIEEYNMYAKRVRKKGRCLLQSNKQRYNLGYDPSIAYA
jgi:hypothetical protein